MLHIPSIMHNSFEVYASIGITDSQRKTHQTETEQRTQKPNRPKKKKKKKNTSTFNQKIIPA